MARLGRRSLPFALAQEKDLSLPNYPADTAARGHTSARSSLLILSPAATTADA